MRKHPIPFRRNVSGALHIPSLVQLATLKAIATTPETRAVFEPSAQSGRWYLVPPIRTEYEKGKHTLHTRSCDYLVAKGFIIKEKRDQWPIKIYYRISARGLSELKRQ